MLTVTILNNYKNVNEISIISGEAMIKQTLSKKDVNSFVYSFY